MEILLHPSFRHLIYLSIHPSIHQSIHPAIYPSIQSTGLYTRINIILLSHLHLPLSLSSPLDTAHNEINRPLTHSLTHALTLTPYPVKKALHLVARSGAARSGDVVDGGGSCLSCRSSRLLRYRMSGLERRIGGLNGSPGSQSRKEVNCQKVFTHKTSSALVWTNILP
jgi:hypothetical protein